MYGTPHKPRQMGIPGNIKDSSEDAVLQARFDGRRYHDANTVADSIGQVSEQKMTEKFYG